MLILGFLILLNQLLIFFNQYKWAIALGVFNLLYFGILFCLHAQHSLSIRL
jgi:hypothetical protein